MLILLKENIQEKYNGNIVHHCKSTSEAVATEHIKPLLLSE